MVNLKQTIIKTLDDAQNGLLQHQKLLATLKQLYDHQDTEKFFEAFFTPFSNALLVFKREPAVERIVEFVSRFTALVSPKQNSENEEEEEESDNDVELAPSFLNLLVLKLLSLHNAKDKAVRFRVCQIVAKIMTHAADMNSSVHHRLLDRIQSVMLHRVYDKISAVRIQAVLALEVLLDPEDPECPVVTAFLELMSRDPSCDVRKCILNNIAVTNQTLPAIIERTRDVKDTVRQSAFALLAGRCSILNLTIQQRVQLLSDGLRDRSDQVQEACVHELLRNWCLTFDGDLLSLLNRLDVESSSEVAELALNKLFASLPSEDLVSTMLKLMAGTGSSDAADEDDGEEPEMQQAAAARDPDQTTQPPPVIPFDLLKCEEAFYWKCLCKYFHEMGVDGLEHLEKILPTLSEFSEYIQRYVLEEYLQQVEVDKKLQSQFVTQQLFSILEVHDYSIDEVGKRRLGALVCDLLMHPSFPPGLVADLLAQQCAIWPQESYRIEKLTEIIAELRHPSSVETTNLSETQFANITHLDLKDDPHTLCMCLCIAAEMLRNLKMQKLGPTLLTLLDALVLPCVQNENPVVRDLALNCLGLASLLDVATAQKHLLLFLQVSQVDHESLQATALRVVFDLLHLYGFESFNMDGGDCTGEDELEEEEEEEDVRSGSPLLVDGSPKAPRSEGQSDGQGEGLLPSEEGKEEEEEEEKGSASKKTTQKILRILANNLDSESTLLQEVAGEGVAKLLLSGRVVSHKLLRKLLVLWYLAEDDERLRGVLGVFFPTFAATDRSYRECLGEIYLPVAQLLQDDQFQLPATTVENMADFLVQLTRPIEPNEDSIHDSMSLAIANQVLSDPVDQLLVRIYCRSLSRMEPSPHNQANAKDLDTLLKQMLQVVKDAVSKRYLNKFGKTLSDILISRASSPELFASPKDRDLNQGKGGDEAEAEAEVEPSDDGVNVQELTVALDQTLVPEETQQQSTQKERSYVLSTVKRRPFRTPRRTPKQQANDSDRESDDSLIGEHSPFIKPSTIKKRHRRQPPVLQFSDEED